MLAATTGIELYYRCIRGFNIYRIMWDNYLKGIGEEMRMILKKSLLLSTYNIGTSSNELRASRNWDREPTHSTKVGSILSSSRSAVRPGSPTADHIG